MDLIKESWGSFRGSRGPIVGPGTPLIVTKSSSHEMSCSATEWAFLVIDGSERVLPVLGRPSKRVLGVLLRTQGACWAPGFYFKLFNSLLL